MTWVKGQSGNPSGKPKGLGEIQALARNNAGAAIKALVDALKDPKLKVQAATALLDRGFGRPSQTIEANVNVFSDLSIEDQRHLAASLAAIASGEADSRERAQTEH